jgi:hypothetical protein
MLCTMPRIAQLDGLDELLDKQLGVVSRGQLLAIGMTDTITQYRVRRGGPWQVLLPGVYLGASGTPRLLQKEMAALLYAGPGSLITGPVALLHHSIRSEPNLDVIDVLVPAERRRVDAGFARLHRTTRMPTRTSSSGPVRLAQVPRAVADTARQHHAPGRPRRGGRSRAAKSLHDQPAGRGAQERTRQGLRDVPLGPGRSGRRHQVHRRGRPA